MYLCNAGTLGSRVSLFRFALQKSVSKSSGWARPVEHGNRTFVSLLGWVP